MASTAWSGRFVLKTEYSQSNNHESQDKVIGLTVHYLFFVCTQKYENTKAWLLGDHLKNIISVASKPTAKIGKAGENMHKHRMTKLTEQEK